MPSLLIIGAKSDIARALARRFAREGYSLYLAARGSADLEALAADIALRSNTEAKTFEFDLLDYSSHADFYNSLPSPPDGVLCVAGYLGDQPKAESDFDEAALIIDTNFKGCVSILNIAANDMSERASGFIIGLSSVAGDRGRQSNYMYGSAKAGFSEYLSGLRNRLTKSGVHVMTVKPGFVNTKMTEGMKLPGLLTAQPEEVASDIYNGLENKKDVLYTKWFWRFIMLIIRHIPEAIFKKLKM